MNSFNMFCQLLKQNVYFKVKYYATSSTQNDTAESTILPLPENDVNDFTVDD